MARAIIAAATLFGGACTAPPPSAYDRYFDSQRAYIANVSKSPELARAVAPAKAIIAAMSPDQVERLTKLGIPLLVAAERDTANREDWATAGSDWTLYAERHDCCRSTREAAAERARIAERTCANTRFRSVVGMVPRSGRRNQAVPMSIVGIVPIGLDAYRGIVLTTGNEHLPVTWQRHWDGIRGDPTSSDPLDDRQHHFRLRRLAGAHNWTVTWDGSTSIADAGRYTDTQSCLAALSAA